MRNDPKYDQPSERSCSCRTAPFFYGTVRPCSSGNAVGAARTVPEHAPKHVAQHALGDYVPADLTKCSSG